MNNPDLETTFQNAFETNNPFTYAEKNSGKVQKVRVQETLK